MASTRRLLLNLNTHEDDVRTQRACNFDEKKTGKYHWERVIEWHHRCCTGDDCCFYETIVARYTRVSDWIRLSRSGSRREKSSSLVFGLEKSILYHIISSILMSAWYQWGHRNRFLKKQLEYRIRDLAVAADFALTMAHGIPLNTKSLQDK